MLCAAGNIIYFCALEVFFSDGTSQRMGSTQCPNEHYDGETHEVGINPGDRVTRLVLGGGTGKAAGHIGSIWITILQADGSVANW